MFETLTDFLSDCKLQCVQSDGEDNTGGPTTENFTSDI